MSTPAVQAATARDAREPPPFGRSPEDLLDDARLVAAVREDAPGAKNRFVERFAPYVGGVLARVMGPGPDLPDLTHEVFVQALTSLDGLRDPAALRSWIRGITVFTARHAMRSRRRSWWLRFLPPREVPEEVDPGFSPEASDDLRRTYAILARMQEELRIAFSLRYLAELELTEVAAACGCSLATTKRRIARAEEQFVRAAGADPMLRERMLRGERWRTP